MSGAEASQTIMRPIKAIGPSQIMWAVVVLFGAVMASFGPIGEAIKNGATFEATTTEKLNRILLVQASIDGKLEGLNARIGKTESEMNAINIRITDMLTDIQELRAWKEDNNPHVEAWKQLKYRVIADYYKPNKE